MPDSVADSGCLSRIPIFHSRIPDPGSGSATLVPDIVNEITDVIMIAKSVAQINTKITSSLKNILKN